MASRTQIVCLHEGKKGRSIDPLFIRTLLKSLKPDWIRPWPGSNVVRTVDKGGRKDLIASMPAELKLCQAAGSNTTLMVWADVDDNCSDPDDLKKQFWASAKAAGIHKEDFESVVFVFAEDRLENWIEFLNSGSTDENLEGPRVNFEEAARAARKLGEFCQRGAPIANIPASLKWSCDNWKALKNRMKA